MYVFYVKYNNESQALFSTYHLGSELLLQGQGHLYSCHLLTCRCSDLSLDVLPVVNDTYIIHDIYLKINNSSLLIKYPYPSYMNIKSILNLGLSLNWSI